MCELRGCALPRAAAPEGAALELVCGEVRAGRLGTVEAVEAVLPRRRASRARGLSGAAVPPHGLARGRGVAPGRPGAASTKEVARQLGITPKTAGNHIEHGAAKIDVA